MHRLSLRRAGFTLLELAIVIAIAGMVVGGSIAGLNAMREKNKMQETRQKLGVIEHALTLYVSRVGALPYAATTSGTNPGTASAGTANGRVPFSALNLTVADTLDAWGNEILYTVSSALAANNSLTCPTAANAAATWGGTSLRGSLNLRDGAGGDSQVAYVVRSRGNNDAWESEISAGATYQYEPGTLVGYDDLVRGRDGYRVLYDGGCRVEKVAANIGGTSGGAGGGAGGGDPPYDPDGDEAPADYNPENPTVVQKNVKHFLNTIALGASGTSSGATKPYEASLTNGDTAFIMGEKDTSDSANRIKPLTTGRVACTWVKEPFQLTDDSFTAGFDFQFFPGTTTKSATGAPADGFTLQLVPYTYDIGNDTSGYACGDGGTSLGHGNLKTPKLAVEFDIYYSSWISDPQYNHVAVVASDQGRGSDADLYHGKYLTPACTSPIPSKPACVWDSTMQAFMEYRNCDKTTYPACDMELVSPTVWNISGKTSNLRTRPYHADITINRWCNSTCSTCGVSGTGQTYTHIQATVTCLAGTSTECGTVAPINTCLSTLSDDAYFGKMRMGFSVATGAETTGVQISGAEINAAFYFDQ